MERVLTPAIQAEQRVRVGRRDIFVAEFGVGSPVLMLHGGGPGASGTANFIKNIPALAKRVRVIVPDLPGYGRSTKGLDRKDPFGDLAGTMVALLDKLGVARAHVIGNSLGGACALRMAIEQPECIGCLVLMGPGGVDTTRGFPTAGLKRLLGYYAGEGPTRDKLAKFLREDLVFDGATVTDAMIDARFQASLDPEVVANPPLVRPKGLPNFRALDFTRDPRLAAVRNPTLVLWGMEDRVNRPSGAHSLQKRMPNCDLHLFSRTGHWVQFERAEEFNAATAAFLSQHAFDL